MYGVLERCVLFAGLTDKETEDALKTLCAQQESYKKGDCVFAGGRLFRFGLVLSGAVSVYCNDINGNRVIMNSVTAGGTFGESLCFLGRTGVPISIFAAEDTTVLRLLPPQNTESEIFSRFTCLLAERTLAMNDRIQILSKQSIREKLLCYFSQCVRKYGARTFSVPLNREALAVYLGCDRAALSRELAKMKHDGIVDFYKNTFKLP